MPKPKPGDKIYVFSTLHLHHGADDFQGGLCTVAATETREQAHQQVTFVEVEEDPGRWILWETYLEPKQDALREAFGERAGRLSPDLRPEFNDGWGPETE